MMSRVFAAGVLLVVTAPAWAGFEASSHNARAPQGKNFHAASSALDSKVDTCWMVDAETKNEGSWIWLDVPSSKVDKLAVMIGWNKSEELHQDYARLKSVKVEMFNVTPGSQPELKGEATVSFEDKMGWQIVDLPDTQVGGEFGGGRVKLTVAEVYEGNDFPSLAVSEVRVHLKEFDAANMSLSDGPSSEASGHGGHLMTDGSSRSFWAAEGPTASFTVNAPGYGLSSLGIMAGPKSYARPKTIKIRANMVEVEHVLADKPLSTQWVLLPALVGYTGGAWGDVTVEIVDTYAGSNPGVAISELKMRAGSIEEF